MTVGKDYRKGPNHQVHDKITASATAKAVPTAAVAVNQNGRSILLTTWMLIFMAGFGDKTQLAVAGLAGAHSALPVWLGATAGLAFTTSLGVWAGRTLLRRLPTTLLQRLSGAFFLMLAAVAGWHILRNF